MTCYSFTKISVNAPAGAKEFFPHRARRVELLQNARGGCDRALQKDSGIGAPHECRCPRAIGAVLGYFRKEQSFSLLGKSTGLGVEFRAHLRGVCQSACLAVYSWGGTVVGLSSCRPRSPHRSHLIRLQSVRLRGTAARYQGATAADKEGLRVAQHGMRHRAIDVPVHLVRLCVPITK